MVSGQPNFHKVEEELKRAMKTWNMLEENQQKQLQVYEDEIKDLKKKSKNAENSSNQKIKLLKRELLKRKKRLYELENAVKEELLPIIDHEEYHKLQEQCLQMKRQSEEKSRLLQAYKDRIQIFQEIIAKIKKQHSFAMNDEEAKQKSLRDKLKRMKKKINENNSKNQSKKANTEDLNQKVVSLEKENATLKKQHLNFSDEQEKNKKELDLLKSENAELKENQKSLEEKNRNYTVKIKKLEEELGAKYLDNENNSCTEEMKLLTENIAELEAKNATLKKQLEKSEKKYQNVLILPGGREELLAENERMKNRLDVIEENFDEAWAGFRLEILRYETNLEKMEDQIETMKAEKDGKVYKRTKPRYVETDSGSFCLLAMKELGELLQFGERSREFLNALNELKFHASSLQKESKKFDGVEVDGSTKLALHHGDTADVHCNKSEDVGDHIEEAANGTSERQENNEDVHDEFSYEDDFEDDHDDVESNKDGNISDENGNVSDENGNSSENDGEISDNDGDILGRNADTSDGIEKCIRDSNSEILTHGNDGINDNEESDDEEIEEEIVEEIVEDIFSRNEDTENEDEMFLPMDPSTIVVVGVCKDPTLRSILKNYDGNKEKMTTKKSLTFNSIVDFQFIDDTVSEGSFLDVLKSPQEKWEIPKVSILDNPRHPISEPSSYKYPTLRNIPTPVESNDNDKNKITAADIFGNNSKTYDDDDVDNDDEFGDLDDAIDFILNM